MKGWFAKFKGIKSHYKKKYLNEWLFRYNFGNVECGLWSYWLKTIGTYQLEAANKRNNANRNGNNNNANNNDNNNNANNHNNNNNDDNNDNDDDNDDNARLIPGIPIIEDIYD